MIARGGTSDVPVEEEGDGVGFDKDCCDYVDFDEDLACLVKVMYLLKCWTDSDAFVGAAGEILVGVEDGLGVDPGAVEIQQQGSRWQALLHPPHPGAVASSFSAGQA